MKTPNKPSPADLARITGNLNKLRDMTASATDFTEPLTFFMDALVADPVFFQLGKVTQEKTIRSLLMAVAPVLLNQMAAVNPSLLGQLAQSKTMPVAQIRIFSLGMGGFFHAGGLIAGHMLTLIYFKDIDQGLGALANHDADGLNVFSRFTAKQFEMGADSTFVPNPSKYMN